MQPYGYQVPRQKLGWGALGDSLTDAGVVYAPPSGWSIAVPFEVVTPSNQSNFTAGTGYESGDVEQYQNAPLCPVLSMAVKAPVSVEAGINAFMPPLGWLAGIISNGEEDQAVWIDPLSKVAYNLRDCTSITTGTGEGASLIPTSFNLNSVLLLAGIVAGGWLLMRYWPKSKAAPRVRGRKRPKRKSRKLRAARRRQASARRFASGGSRRKRSRRYSF